MLLSCLPALSSRQHPDPLRSCFRLALPRSVPQFPQQQAEHGHAQRHGWAVGPAGAWGRGTGCFGARVAEDYGSAGELQ